MKRLLLAVALSSLSMVGHASSQIDVPVPPFEVGGMSVPSERNTDAKDIVINLIATQANLVVKDIIVNDGACQSYKKIPANFTLEKDMAFNLTFYAKDGKDCYPESVKVVTDKDYWEVY